MSEHGSSEAEGATGDPGPETMACRAGASRVKLWLLIEANRWLVTGVVLAVVFAALVALGAVDPSPLRAALSDGDPIGTLFQAYVAAIITGVTLVVTINQLVLSQELGAVGDQRSRMGEALDFRDAVADALGAETLSPDPSTFLRAIVDGAADRASELAGTLDDQPGDTPSDVVDEVVGYADGVTESAWTVSDQLEDARFGTFAVISAVLDFDYSRMLFEARRLRGDHGDALPAPADAALADLVTVLSLFGPAREHFKTLYFQWELINLSRAILYAAVPAVVVTSATILYVDAAAVTGATLGVDDLVWLVSGVTTVALAPFALLFAYVLRIATVAKRTLAIGPFILRDSDR